MYKGLENKGKYFYCLLKSSYLVGDFCGQQPYQPLALLI